MVLNSNDVLVLLKDPENRAMPQQHGVDLTVREIYTISGDMLPAVLANSTSPLQWEPRIRQTYRLQDGSLEGWYLAPGLYSIEFDQGVEIPANCKANIIHRSSIARVGGQIYSGEYDAGFKTDNAGAFLVLHHECFIQEHARVAQIVVQEVKDGVRNLYNGQWQGK